MRALALAVALGFAAPASEPGFDPMQRLDAWVRAVDAHAAGDDDAALATMASWKYADFDVMRPYLEVLVETPNDNNPERKRRLSTVDKGARTAIADVRTDLQLKPRMDSFRQRAAIFHTDAALLRALPLIVTAPPKQPALKAKDQPRHIVDVRSADGLVDSYQLANPNWELAGDMLDAVAATTRAQIVPQWYRAIGAYFAQKDDLANAMRHYQRARRIVPDDPGVLFGEACFQEALGSPSVQNFAHVTTLPNGYTLLGVFPPQTHFRNATMLLRRALAGQPGFVEARLRLGRMLSAQREYAASLPHLSQVIAGTTDPALLYYAHLFAGEALLALDRAADAQMSYEHALELRPNARAARLGLATALRATGDRAAANAEVMTTVSIAPEQRDDGDDPWWNYYKGDAANVERLLAELREPFTRPAR